MTQPSNVVGVLIAGADVNVNANAEPDAKCKLATKNADATCEACVDTNHVNNSSDDSYRCSNNVPPLLTLFFTYMLYRGWTIFSHSHCNGYSRPVSCVPDVTVQDIMPPVITVVGSNPQTKSLCAMTNMRSSELWLLIIVMAIFRDTL